MREWVLALSSIYPINSAKWAEETTLDRQKRLVIGSPHLFKKQTVNISMKQGWNVDNPSNEHPASAFLLIVRRCSRRTRRTARMKSRDRLSPVHSLWTHTTSSSRVYTLRKQVCSVSSRETARTCLKRFMLLLRLGSSRINFFAKVELLYEQINWSYDLEPICRTHVFRAPSRYRSLEHYGDDDHYPSCSISHVTVPRSSDESCSHRGMAHRSLWDLPVDCCARPGCAFRPFRTTPHSLHLPPRFRVRLSHLRSWRCTLAALPRTHHRWPDGWQHQHLVRLHR